MIDGEQMSFAQQLPRGEAIARLNDTLRKKAVGGRIMMTRGVHQLVGSDTAELLRSLAEYDGFDADNDPHGERDFGDIEVHGQTLLWKIDYYDLELMFGSPDPADPCVTTRVLTVMLENEF